LSLSDDEVVHVLDVLKTAPITHIFFNFLHLTNHRSSKTATEACTAFHRLCDAFRAIRTITSATMEIMNDILSDQFGYATEL
jgi:hypothetical protein